MLFKQILMIVISCFFVLGLADRFFGNRLGLGDTFTSAFLMAGRVMLNALGMICLAPALARWLSPIVTPLFTAIGSDPSMFASLLLSPDGGAYAVALEMTADPKIGLWAGTVVASHMGSMVSFAIPTAVGIIDKAHHRNLAMGALCGIAACPFGCLFGGILCSLKTAALLINLVPVLALSALIVLGLSLRTELSIKVFSVFGRLITAVVYIGLAAAAVERVTGYVIIPGMAPFSDGMLVVGTVVITMCGISVMTNILSRLLKKPLARASAATGINEEGMLHMLNALASTLPGCSDYHKMNPKSQILFAAFICSAAYTLGAHLAFIGVAAPEMLPAMIAGKLFSACLAILLALYFVRKTIGPRTAS